ncbi:MAG: DUF3422 family protein [Nitrospirota bacterium]|nr:DUF3422 family protein [Nitrospirota bacterium]
MKTPIVIHKERCNLCGGAPACVPACPQQILTTDGRRIVLTHTNRCPEGCTICVDVCDSHVFSLVEEVHNGLGVVPAERINGPARLHHVSYLRDEEQGRDEMSRRFSALCDRLGIPDSQRTQGETRAHAWGTVPGHTDTALQLTWELHTEYYFVRAILAHDEGSSKHDQMPDEKLVEVVVPHLQAFGRPPLLTCLDILVADRPLGGDEVCDWIVCRNRFGARVLGGDLAVYTNYEPVSGRERYVLCGTPEAIRRHGAFAAANICQIENYYHLLMIPRTEVRDVVQEAYRMEKALGQRIRAITAAIAKSEPAQMEEWLKDLTVDLSRVVGWSARFNHVLSASFPYGEMVRGGFAEWKETPVEGFSLLSPIIIERVTSVVEEYRAFSARLDRLENEVSDLVAILRTRAEMNMESQNTQLLQNLDARSAIQLRLQEMAEGLSVIVISYYLTGLAGYVFKALEKQRIIDNATIPTAVFIPVAVATAFYIAHRGVSKLRKKASRISSHPPAG